MIANAQRYGIIDSDPWGEESLNSVASKFFEEEDFTKESLAIFFGEGLVRVHGGQWKIMAGERTENLQISLVFYVDFGEKVNSRTALSDFCRSVGCNSQRR